MSTVLEHSQERHPDLTPDPERRERLYTIVSVDDHVVEPPHMFEGRLPKQFADRTPRVVVNEAGHDAWLIEGNVLENVGFNAHAGRRHELGSDPVSFAGMRPSVYDIDARVADMDLDGIYASLCFPSFVGGFGGVRLQTLSKDTEFALALVRAWNDWHFEEWAGPYPGRIIPNQLPYLHDSQIAADEIYKNAERGFHSVTFPESPHEAGLPSLHSGFWDKFVQACADTDTVICVHTGSAGVLPATAIDAPRDVTSALFGAGYSLTTTVDWFYSQYAYRHPSLKIVISEGGLGWVPSLLDRLDHHYGKQGDRTGMWTGSDLSPSELLQRNFWFCLLDEPSAVVLRHRIGIDRILFETDFPHADASWPDSQALLHKHIGDLPKDEQDKIAWRNAAELFRLDIPAAVQADPNAY
jgi:predicted TIM-barrel fold metal-dependent hydrolase